MIHMGSDRFDQLKLIVDTKSCSTVSMSKKVSKSRVRVNEDGEGQMTVNRPSAGVAKGQGHIPLNPSKSRKCLINSIDNEPNCSSFLQESNEGSSSLQGIYLTAAMTFVSITKCS